MNIKRLIAGAAAAALILGTTAAPAFATYDGDGGAFTLIKNWAWVKNITITKADTGDNSISGSVVSGGDIDTGDAGAASVVTNDVNTTLVDTCGCDGATIIKNKAKVKNVTITKADTGDNSISGSVVSGGDIDTGDAGAASVVTNTVNLNMVGFVI